MLADLRLEKDFEGSTCNHKSHWAATRACGRVMRQAEPRRWPGRLTLLRLCLGHSTQYGSEGSGGEPTDPPAGLVQAQLLGQPMTMAWGA